MNQYKKVNLIVGWVVFAIAAFTYISTIESTASFWDCGEFITSAWKLEVGHPPGAPFFMMLGRVFTLFAFGDVTKVAVTINILSALASAFTILFLFWSITHIAKKIIIKSEVNFNLGNTIAIMAAGAVGSLAYTFSDSFWFSAVEGEVYATSALFTALVFWSILKWENVADQPGSSRWLIFIAYMMGLSIGVHLLNLLAIPAIVFIYYFKKYQVSTKGVIYTSLIAILLLGVVQYGVIPGIPAMAQFFELVFVNSFGLPFNSGTIFYLLLIVGFIVWGIWYSHKKQKPVFNTIMVAFTVLVIGYSSYAMIVIRSAADTPMDQNDPETVFDLVYYLNREQYGDRPLVSGQYFNSQVVKYDQGSPQYIKKDGKYVVADRKVIRVFDPKTKTIFPRMYSDQESPNHIEGYIRWAGLNQSDLYQVLKRKDGSVARDAYGKVRYDHSKPLKTPTFSENLKFFFKYQIGFMYMRYFLWNFAGRQNDIQGHGEIQHGNWISGISAIDNARLGNQDLLPKPLKNNKGRNMYYFFPLILGLIGMYYMFIKNQRDFWVLLLFFFMTGLAIVLYLNQPPYQPRERDYAYAGSFYVFAMYIGLGVLMLIEWLNKISKNTIVSASIIALVTLVAVPGVMAQQNWDDHDRSGRTTARDFAYNYLNSCAPNAILFTNGDNDTFPLWYAQEVEGIRTDVRVINLSYLNTDWYTDQMRKKSYKSDPVPFSLTADQTQRGTRDAVYFFEQKGVFIKEKYEAFKNKYEARYQNWYSKFVSLLQNSDFPTTQKKDFAKLNTEKPTFSPDVIAGLMDKLEKYKTALKFNATDFDNLKNNIDDLVAQIANEPTPLKDVIRFIGDDSDATKVRLQDNKMHNFLPTRKFIIPVDKDVVLKNHVVSEKDSDKITNVEWTFNRSVLRKADLMVLDLLANNNWKRPVYFAITVGPSNYMGLQNYFQQEGLAYRVVPIKNSKGRQTGRVEPDIMYNNLMHKFRFDELRDTTVYFDENNTRMMMNFRNNFTRLANAFIDEGKNQKAIEVLDYCSDLLPNSLVAYNYYNILMSQAYNRAGATEKAKSMIRVLSQNSINQLRFYLSLKGDKANQVGESKDRAIAIMYEIKRVASLFGDKTFTKEINDKFDALANQMSI